MYKSSKSLWPYWNGFRTSYRVRLVFDRIIDAVLRTDRPVFSHEKNVVNDHSGYLNRSWTKFLTKFCLRGYKLDEYENSFFNNGF